MHRQRDLFRLKLILAVIATLFAVAASCCLGSSNVTLGEVIKYFSGMKDELSPTVVTIIGRVRVPRVFTAALCGGALASVGCVMQGLFRNPMADPSVLGISSGSALGAAIAIVSGLNIVIIGEGFTGSYIGAIIGAAVTWMMVFLIARSSGEYDTSSTLLAGIAISSIMSAFITVLMTLHMDSMERVYMWMLGTFRGHMRTASYLDKSSYRCSEAGQGGCIVTGCQSIEDSWYHALSGICSSGFLRCQFGYHRICRTYNPSYSSFLQSI